MTAADARAADERLLLILDGLVPLQLMRLSNPRERERAFRKIISSNVIRFGSDLVDDPVMDSLADVIASYSDRLTAPGNFRKRADHHERGRVLNAVATALALGAFTPGGVTFAGRHWCTDHRRCERAAARLPDEPSPDAPSGDVVTPPRRAVETVTPSEGVL